VIEMETRKIQTTKSGSYFVTLPKPWVEKLDIEKNKELMMSIDEDNNLVIYPLRNQESYVNEFILPIEDYLEENSLERCINSSYIQGADIINIASKNTIALEKKRLLKDAVSNLIGTEISEEFANRISIRILVDPLKFPLANLINRIYMLVSSMHADAVKAFQESDKILAEDVINREREVDKLFFLMIRQLNLSLTNRLNLSDICMSAIKIDCVLGIVLARDLSKMAHYAAEIAKECVKLVEKESIKLIDKELKEYISKMSRFTIKMQQNAILAFFKSDFMRANNVLNDIQEVIEFDHKTEQMVLDQVKDNNLIVSLITISRNLRNIANSAVDVAQDLQAKYRPKETYKREFSPEQMPNALDIVTSLGNEKE